MQTHISFMTKKNKFTHNFECLLNVGFEYFRKTQNRFVGAPVAAECTKNVLLSQKARITNSSRVENGVLALWKTVKEGKIGCT